MDIYETNKIQNFKRLGVQIEYITAYDDVLLVSAKDGNLIRCEAKAGQHGVKWDWKSKDNFSKKTIVQMQAIPDFSLLIHIEDGFVVVHDLQTFEPKTVLQQTKGATLFAIDMEDNKSAENRKNKTLRMCVATGRKIQLYYWKGDDFEVFENELSLIKTVKVMTWCKDAICVGFKDEYFMIKPKTGALKELFTVGSNQKEPLITRLSDDNLLLGYDNKSIFINYRGKPYKDYPITWSAVPQCVVHDQVYMVALLPRRVEIRSMDPVMLIQQAELKNAKLMCRAGGSVYIASSTSVWCLKVKPRPEQIGTFLKHKHFELALQLAEMSGIENEEQDEDVRRIKTQYAVHQFAQQHFEDSMLLFRTLDTDPTHVIGLFPNLLPAKLKGQLEYPEKLPPLEGVDLERAIVALTDYLNQKRKEFQNIAGFPSMAPIMKKDSNVTLKTRDQLFSVIDTTLLKCYLKTNDALIAPLLRDPENKVHLQEAEKALEKNEKYSELVILYQVKGEHEKALELLKRQATKSASQLKGLERTIQYLQTLGCDHLGLIFKHSVWVLKADPVEGLRIFTDNIPEVESLPRGHVLSFLTKEQPDLVIPYLDHVIYVWRDTTEEFHNKFADYLRKKIQEPGIAKKKGSEKDAVLYAELEDNTQSQEGCVRDYRKILLHHIQTSEYYDAEEILPRFPVDDFFEERAILLGHLGRHEQALGIYILILKEPRKAEDHCFKYYKKTRQCDNDVYISLLRVYLFPPEPSSLGVQAYDTPPQSNPEAAFRILEEHGKSVDITKAMEILPDDIKVKDINLYIASSLQLKVSRRFDYMVRKRMQFAAYLQVSEERLSFDKTFFEISDEQNCEACHRRIGNRSLAAQSLTHSLDQHVKNYFARYPNGVIVHYACCKDPKIPPASALKMVSDDVFDMLSPSDHTETFF